jgi:hypothetical protein
VSLTADALRKLAALRLDADQMAGVLDVLADMQSVEEERKAKQRERTRKHREQRDCNVTETSPSRYGDVTAPSPSLAKEIPPRPPKENSTLTPSPSLLDSAGDAFERFRRAYPRRSGPWKPAKQKFIGLVRSGEDAEEIIRGAEEFARLKAEADPQFIPMPATWLNQERWKDPPDPSRGPTNVRQFAKPDDGKAKFRDALARFRGEAPGPSAADEGAITAEFKVVSSD